MRSKTPLSKLLLVAILALAFVATSGVWAAPDDHDDHDDTALEQSVEEAGLGLDVRMALLDELGWDAMDIDIDVTGTSVTLTGEVESAANRDLAKDLARNVDGVTDVVTNLSLEDMDDDMDRDEMDDRDTPVADSIARGAAKAEREVNDALLETRVKSHLIKQVGGDAFEIEVEATDGVVRLLGEVDSEEQATIAMETAKKVEGVTRVVNLTKID